MGSRGSYNIYISYICSFYSILSPIIKLSRLISILHNKLLMLNNMKFRYPSLIILSIIFIFYSAVSADFLSTSRRYVINWSKGFIITTVTASIHIEPNGIPTDYYSGNNISLNKARIEAYNRAKAEAVENIMSAIKTIRIDSDRTLLDFIKEDKYTQKNIARILYDHIAYKEFPSSFSTSACEAKLKFGEIIASLPYNFPFHDFPAMENIPIETAYSGLIIDGRGLKLETMLFPSIHDEDGMEIYGRIYIDSHYACKKGIVSFCYNEYEALKHPNAGTKPYFAVAIKSINGCPVISENDKRKLLSSKITINNLKKCNVIIILDKKN
jgi:hypothetical protein